MLSIRVHVLSVTTEMTILFVCLKNIWQQELKKLKVSQFLFACSFLCHNEIWQQRLNDIETVNHRFHIFGGVQWEDLSVCLFVWLSLQDLTAAVRGAIGRFDLSGFPVNWSLTGSGYPAVNCADSHTWLTLFDHA